MIERLERIIIRPWEEPVFGWERKKDPRIVWAIIQAIRRGVDVPPVYARQRGDRGYSLDTNYTDPAKGLLAIDGGHNRSIAHAIAEVPLEAHLVPGKPAWRCRIPVIDVVFREKEYDFREYASRHHHAAHEGPPDLDFMNERLEKVRHSLFEV